MKSGILVIVTLLSQIGLASEPHLNLRCKNLSTFLPEPPHIGDIQTDDKKVVVQVQNVALFHSTQLAELVAVIDPSLKEKDFKSVEFEVTREQCQTKNLKISIEGFDHERVLPTLNCLSTLNKIAPAQIKIQLNDGSQKSFEALLDISLHFEGIMSAWATDTALNQHLSIRVLDPQTTWKELVAIEVLGSSGTVCEPN